MIDAVGFNEKFWMSRDGLPHTDRLHLIEKFTRADFNTLRYEVTVDDPACTRRRGRAVFPFGGPRESKCSNTCVRAITFFLNRSSRFLKAIRIRRFPSFRRGVSNKEPGMRHRLTRRIATLAAATMLAATPSLFGQGAPGAESSIFAQGDRVKAASRPTPHWPDGRVNLGPVPGETGLWLPIDARISLADKGPGRGPGAGKGRAALRQEHQIQRGAVSALGESALHGPSGTPDGAAFPLQAFRRSSPDHDPGTALSSSTSPN